MAREKEDLTVEDSTVEDLTIKIIHGIGDYNENSFIEAHNYLGVHKECVDPLVYDHFFDESKYNTFWWPTFQKLALLNPWGAAAAVGLSRTEFDEENLNDFLLYSNKLPNNRSKRLVNEFIFNRLYQDMGKYKSLVLVAHSQGTAVILNVLNNWDKLCKATNKPCVPLNDGYRRITLITCGSPLWAPLARWKYGVGSPKRPKWVDRFFNVYTPRDFVSPKALPDEFECDIQVKGQWLTGHSFEGYLREAGQLLIKEGI